MRSCRLYLCLLAFTVVLCVSASSQSAQVEIAHLEFGDTTHLSEAESAVIIGEVEGSSCPSKYLEKCISSKVVNAFQEHGYFKANVQRVVLKSPAGLNEAEAKVFADPGSLYRISKFEFEGKLVFDRAELEPLITVRSGEVFDVRRLRETMANLHTYYTGRGYGNTSVEPHTSADDTKHTISISFDIQADIGR